MKEDMRIGKLIALLLWVVAAVAAFGCFAENQYSLAFACIFSGLFSGALLWEIASCVEQLKGIRRILFITKFQARVRMAVPTRANSFSSRESGG